MLELGAFGTEVLRSLRTYLANDQSVEATAAALFVHPNTLRHRLARFEETTGACLRNVDRLTEVWWALQLDALHGA
jgi:DNA-binding PucR family transcriptional regulator